MTTKNKRRRLSTPTTHSKTQSNKKGKRRADDTDIVINSDDVTEFTSNLKGDLKQIKRYANDILHDDRSTIELRSDGSIVMTPHPQQLHVRLHPRQLPNEIVSLIINHLPKQRKSFYKCTLVNRQFHVIANPLLWHTPNLNNSNIAKRFRTGLQPPPPPPQQLEPPGRHIRELSLKGVHWTNPQLIRLLPHIPHIKNLAISFNTGINDTSFQHLPNHCQQLTSLDVTGVGLTRVSFSAIARYCRRLCDLKCRVMDSQCQEWLPLLKQCPLKELHVDFIDSAGMNERVATIIQSFDQLTSLAITGVTSDATTFLLTTTTTTTTLWPQLTHLKLGSCYGLDHDLVLQFIMSHPHLQHLDLKNFMRLTDIDLYAMVDWLPHLTHLALSGNNMLTGNGIRRFIQTGVPNLASVVLTRCRRIQRHDFPEFTDILRAITKLDRTAIEHIRRAQID